MVAVPSYNESFGLVALEAQACGTPVVAARVGGLPSRWRDGRPGCSCPATAPRSGPTPSARDRQARRLGEGAVAHAHAFSWDRTADALLATYTASAAEFTQRQRVLAGMAS